jgi:hypothetical protein
VLLELLPVLVLAQRVLLVPLVLPVRASLAWAHPWPPQPACRSAPWLPLLRLLPASLLPRRTTTRAPATRLPRTTNRRERFGAPRLLEKNWPLSSGQFSFCFQ